MSVQDDGAFAVACTLSHMEKNQNATKWTALGVLLLGGLTLRPQSAAQSVMGL